MQMKLEMLFHQFHNLKKIDELDCWICNLWLNFSALIMRT